MRTAHEKRKAQERIGEGNISVAARTVARHMDKRLKLADTERGNPSTRNAAGQIGHIAGDLALQGNQRSHRYTFHPIKNSPHQKSINRL